MSRSSEIRTQKFKASRQRQHLLQGGAEAQFLAEEEAHEQEELPSFFEVDDFIPTLENLDRETFNFHPFLIEALQITPYFLGKCRKISQFSTLLEEVSKIQTLDAFLPSPSGKRIASPAFCLLFRALELRLRRKQFNLLLTSSTGVYAKAIAVLYIRYAGIPDQYWDWLEVLLIDDNTWFTPFSDSGQVSLGAWTQSVVLESRYGGGTLLPRVLVKTEELIRSKLLRTLGMTFHVGEVCLALYPVDKRWYDARVDAVGEEPNTFKVTFLPEEEYGNQEDLSVSYMRKGRHSPDLA